MRWKQRWGNSGKLQWFSLAKRLQRNCPVINNRAHPDFYMLNTRVHNVRVWCCIICTGLVLETSSGINPVFSVLVALLSLFTGRWKNKSYNLKPKTTFVYILSLLLFILEMQLLGRTIIYEVKKPTIFSFFATNIFLQQMKTILSLVQWWFPILLKCTWTYPYYFPLLRWIGQKPQKRYICKKALKTMIIFSLFLVPPSVAVCIWSTSW